MIEYPFPLEGDTDDPDDPMPWIADIRDNSFTLEQIVFQARQALAAEEPA